MTPCRRVFLDWTPGFLDRCAAWIVERHGEGGRCACSGVLVLTPTARAGRLLEGALVDACAARDMLLDPPTIDTVPRAVVRCRAARTPSKTARLVAWHRAWSDTRDVRDSLAVNDTVASGLAWCRAVARSADLLAMHLLSFGALLRAPIALEGEERSRLEACARLERVQRAVLERAGYRDADEDASPAVRGWEEVVLLAPFDATPRTRRAIECATPRVHTLVMAPGLLEARFDAWGVPIPSVWDGVDVPVSSESIRFAHDADDQAEAAWAAIASIDPPVDTRAVVIGAVDSESVDALERVALDHGVQTRRSTVSDLSGTSVGCLLSRLSDVVLQGRTRDVLQLIRHPDVERVLSGMRALPGDASWLEIIDRYAARSLLDRWRWEGSFPGAREHERPVLEACRSCLQALLGDLADARPRPMERWVESVITFCGRVYASRELDGRSASGAALITGLSALVGFFDEVVGIDDGARPFDACMPVLQAYLRDRTLADDPDAGAVELLGWLELALDTSEHRVVCDLSETFIPSRPAHDPILSDRLVGALGLPRDADRSGRDAYLLSAIAASSSTCVCISKGLNDRADPLTPSRLLFRTNEDAALDRARRAFGAERDPMPGARLEAIGRGHGVPDGFETMPRVPAEPPEVWPVTAFRRFLRSPYECYVRVVLGRREWRGTDGELDAAGFGDVVHEALRRFGEDEHARGLDAPEPIADAMSAHLLDTSRAWFGADPPTGVWIQIEQARARLRTFAAAQSAWVRDGWAIVKSEWSPPEPVELDHDGTRCLISGQIDRIDRNERTGDWAILDYKTGAGVSDPASSHRGSAGWTDLQLPLYRALARSFGVGDEPRVGYASLASSREDIGIRCAPWTIADFDDAERRALEIVGAVERGDWFIEGPRPARVGVMGALMGQGMIGAGAWEREGEA